MARKKQKYLVVVPQEIVKEEQIDLKGMLEYDKVQHTFTLASPTHQVREVREDGTVRIKKEGGNTPLEFTTGEVVRVPAWIVKKVITSLRVKYPKVEVISNLYMLMQDRTEEEYRDEIRPYIPFVFIDLLKQKEEDDSTEFLLWMLACYWYQYAHGPRPDTSKVTKPRSVEDEFEWYNKLECPLCHHKYDLPLGTRKVVKKVDGKKVVENVPDRSKTMTEYSAWLSKHARECQRPVKSARKAKEDLARELEMRNKTFQSKALREIRAMEDAEEQRKEYERIIKAQQRALDIAAVKEQKRLDGLRDGLYFEELRKEVKVDAPVIPLKVQTLRRKLLEAIEEVEDLVRIYEDKSLSDYQKIMLNAYPVNIERAKKRANQLQEKLFEVEREEHIR